jgi:hypothetical protein
VVAVLVNRELMDTELALQQSGHHFMVKPPSLGSTDSHRGDSQLHILDAAAQDIEASLNVPIMS